MRDAIARSRGQRHIDAALVIDLVTLHRPEAIAARSLYTEGGVLHQAGLIESVPITSRHVSSALEQELVSTPRLLRILDGHTGLDPRFAGIAALVTSDGWAHGGVMSSDAVDRTARLVAATERATGTTRGASLLIAGPHGVGKLRVARAVAARCGIARLLVVEAALLPDDGPRLRAMIGSLAYEAELLGSRLVLRGIEQRAHDARQAAMLLAILRNSVHIVWATSDEDPRSELGSPLATLAAMAVSVPYPDLVLRQDAWAAEALAAGVTLAEDKIRELASDYPLSRSAIADVAAAYASTPDPAPEALTELADAKMSHQLARYARRGRSRVRLGDLVLPEHVREQLTEICNAVQHRRAVFDRWGFAEQHAIGRGIVTLFNGPPGTGKTMAANALANSLGLPMYRINTTNIVDRYVGETEKNLQRLFDEASASRAALLFDEADSLFGKRTEAVGLIAGGAGALAGAGGAAAAEGAEASVADTTMETVKGGAEKAEKGIGMVGKVVGAAMTLYYEKEVRAFKATMTAAASEIKGWDMANEALAMEKAQAEMDQAVATYKVSVDEYDAAINDRRTHMAAAGAAADVKAGGKDQKNSMAMLWIESVMESQSLVKTAAAAGNDAKTKLASVRSDVSSHRNFAWSNIEDIWGNGGGSDRREGSGGPDVKAIATMSRLTESWLDGATHVEGFLDKSVGSADGGGEAATLAKSGYSGPI